MSNPANPFLLGLTNSAMLSAFENGPAKSDVEQRQFNFSKHKFRLAVPRGWRIAGVAEEKNHAWCVLQQDRDGLVNRLPGFGPA